MRQDESVGIEPLGLRAQDYRSRERRIERRPVRISRISIARAIGTDQRRERETSQQRYDAIHLPPAEHFALESARAVQPALARAERQFVVS